MTHDPKIARPLEFWITEFDTGRMQISFLPVDKRTKFSSQEFGTVFPREIIHVIEYRAFDELLKAAREMRMQVDNYPDSSLLVVAIDKFDSVLKEMGIV